MFQECFVTLTSLELRKYHFICPSVLAENFSQPSYNYKEYLLFL
jgi:hypothetical protein